MRLLSLTDYADLARPSLDWTIHKLIPRPGLVVLLGPPKEGKSFLALDLSLAVAQGRPFLGYPTVQGAVWYLQLDTGEGLWRQRLHDLREAGHDLNGPIYMAHPEDQPRGFNILRAADQTFVRDALKTCDPALIVIDVLRKFHSADENDSTEMKRVSDVMDELFAGRSLLVVHHTKKIPETVENPNLTNLSRGSSFLTGQADAIWLLHNQRLKIESRFDEPVTYSAIKTDTGMWSFPGVQHLTEAQARVLGLCQEFPGETHNRLSTIARERWGMSRASYYRYLAGQTCAHTRPADVADGPEPTEPDAPAAH